MYYCDKHKQEGLEWGWLDIEDNLQPVQEKEKAVVKDGTD